MPPDPVRCSAAQRTGRSADQLADRSELELGDRLGGDPPVRVERERAVVAGKLRGADWPSRTPAWRSASIVAAHVPRS